MPSRGAWVVALALGLVAGCVTLDPASTPAATRGGPPARPVVVALLDSGVNPYHAAFAAAPGRPDAAALFPEATPVPLAAQGALEDRLHADDAAWRSLEKGRLYAFPGTRVLGVTIAHLPDDPPLFDAFGHGTMTSSLVARAAPDAVILMVQVDASTCLTRNTGECQIHPSVAEALAWVADQPWVDVVTTSIALPLNAPSVTPEAAAHLAASRRASDAGKLVLNAAGNLPGPTLPSYFNGPPWVVAVGGVEPRQGGAAVLASQGLDVAANYTEWVADATTLDAWRWSGGTSFSSPIVAGVAAKALALVRQARPDAAARELRPGLNATARVLGPTAWRPTEKNANDSYWSLVSQSVPVVAPAAQTGWGYVDESLAEAIAAFTLDGGDPTGGKAQVAPVQAQWQATRERYWG